MTKYECKSCGNTEASQFRGTSDTGIALYNGKRYFYFEHFCKCNHPMYVLANSTFTERFQVNQDSFEVVKTKRNTTEYTEE